MNRLAVDFSRKLGVRIEPRLVRTPVVPGAPELDQSLQVVNGNTAAPTNSGQLARPASAIESLMQIINIGLRNVDVKGTDLSARRRGCMCLTRIVRTFHEVLLSQRRMRPTCHRFGTNCSVPLYQNGMICSVYTASHGC